MSDTVEVVFVSPPPRTDCDAAIAQALSEEEAPDAGKHAANGGSGGPDGQGSPEAPLPSAPPLPPLPPEDAGPAPPPLNGSQASLEAVSRYDEQLARDLQEEELKQLSAQEREHLAAVPSLLSSTPLVRTLSDKLASLAGVSFAKLVPQVNPSAAAAAAEAAAELGEQPSGRALLEQRLRLYCLVERVVKGDGSCQFRSLSDQLYRTPRLHAFVREVVVQQLHAHSDWYRDYVLPGNFEQYCADMAKPRTWGDHVTLQAAADAFGIRVWVLTSFESACFLEIEPRQWRSSRVLLLSFFAEVHYNSVYPENEPPQPLPDDKLLGSRRLYSLLWGRCGA